MPSLTNVWQRISLSARPPRVRMLGFTVGLSTLPFQVQLPVPARVPPIITGSIRVGIGPGMFNCRCVASAASHGVYPVSVILSGWAFTLPNSPKNWDDWDYEPIASSLPSRSNKPVELGATIGPMMPTSLNPSRNHLPAFCRSKTPRTPG